jgi:hypothetical protein
MKKTILATLTLAAVFLLAGNLFAQNVDEQARREKILKGMNALSFSAPSLNTNSLHTVPERLLEDISRFFQTENIVERTKIVDEAIEQLPIAESYTLVFLDSMGNYITPFIEGLLTAETLEDFDKSKALLTMFGDRFDNKVRIYNASISNAETTEAANKDVVYQRVLEIYGSIYYPVEQLWNKEAFEEASKQVYDYMVSYKEMEIAATRKITTMPSYEEFKKKLSKQIVSYASLYPHIVIDALNHKDLGLQKTVKQIKQYPMMELKEEFNPPARIVEPINSTDLELQQPVKQIKQYPMMDHMSISNKDVVKRYFRFYNNKEDLISLRNMLKSSESKFGKKFVEIMDKDITNRIAEIEKNEKEQNEQKVKELEKSLNNQKEKGLPLKK